MRAATLFTILLLPLATPLPDPTIPRDYEPVSADPNEWDPSHPPLAAVLYGDRPKRPGAGADTEELLIPDPGDKGETADLTQTEVDGWQWPAYLTAAANCPPDKIKNWTCGIDCQRAGVVHIIYAGGDDEAVPWWYIGKSGPTAVVAIKGTNTKSFRSLLNDAKFDKDNLDDVQVKVNGNKVDAFPDSKGAEAHTGFLDVFKDIQPQLQTGIQQAFAQNATRVLVMGHSLGAAVAQLSALYLQRQFPNVTVSARLFGSPRIGDPDYADYVDKTLGNRTLSMVNQDDMISHLPPSLFHYKHSSGEIYSQNGNGTWEWCKGQENSRCSDSVDGEFSNRHNGPFAGVWMDCTQPDNSSMPNVTNYNWTDTGLVNGGQS